MSRLLELENGERIEQPTEAQVLEAFAGLGTGNPKLVLQRAPFEILLVMREFQNRYHFMLEKKGEASMQSVHPVSGQIAQSSVLGYMKGDNTWENRMRWEKVTVENNRNVPRQVSIDKMDDATIEKYLVRVNRQLFLFGGAFCLILISIIFFLDIGSIMQWKGDQFNLLLGIMLPLWLTGAGFVMTLKRRRLLEANRGQVSDLSS